MYGSQASELATLSDSYVARDRSHFVSILNDEMFISKVKGDKNNNSLQKHRKYIHCSSKPETPHMDGVLGLSSSEAF